MAIGVICAIPQELAHLRAALDHAASETHGGIRFDHGRLDDHDVILAEAGIGKVNSAMVATLLLDRFATDMVVFSGVAGGLDPSLAIGDVVIAARTIQHDFGVIEHEELAPYQPGHVPFFNPTDRFGFEIAPDLRMRVQTRLEGLVLPPLSRRAGGPGRPPRVLFGTVLSGDQFIHCEATRTKLHDRFEAQAVEMEGAAIAQVCERFDRPWLLIRALSDLAGADSRIDFAAFVDEVARSSATILHRVLPALDMRTA